MKIEVSMEDAVAAVVDELSEYAHQNTAYMCECFMYSLLNVTNSDEGKASILLNIIECFEHDYPGVLNKAKDCRTQREQDERDMPGGFN
jgi:hypothetical protein